MMENFLSNLSIIIPLAEGEVQWKSLLPCLKYAFGKSEIILVSSSNPLKHDTQYLKWVESPNGRAIQLNNAAKAATRKLLWFIHADTQFDVEAFRKLELSFQKYPDALHYFDLSFHDGPLGMRINQLGLLYRTRILKMPFGDQGLAIKKELFNLLYGYEQGLPYGEDHHFVWKCHQESIKVVSTKYKIKTSARKYQDKWLKTTIKHLYLTYKQALPEFYKVIKKPQKSALACFVKTPGLSPLKTRLGKSIGQEKAERFHTLSCLTIDRTLQQVREHVQGFHSFWSVAEELGQTHQMWSSHFTINQGSGTLGDRLHYTYQKLRQQHQQVIFIGADAPQLKAQLIEDSIERLKTHDFVLGPATDGGYYLFAGKKNLTHQNWMDVPYSVENTYAEFKKILEANGSVAILRPLTDVDTINELYILKNELEEAVENKELREFIDELSL